MKKFSLLVCLLVFAVAFSVAGLSSDGHAAKKTVVGFSQIGAESEWRTAMSDNVKEAIEKAGYVLKFSDAQQKQENQLKAIRAFIAQKVDFIVLAPVVQTGWDAVLQEARNAKIPVIIVNRSIKVSTGKPEDYYLTFLGPDNIEAGRIATRWFVDYMKNRPGDINMVVLEGTVGSSSAVERKTGFDEIIKANPRFKVIKSQSGDFTRARGKEVMEAFLKSAKAEGKTIDALFAHCDDMAIGAIQAIEEAGLKPGKDIIIFAIDGVKGAFEAMAAGKMNCTTENPNEYGPALVKIIKEYTAKKTINKRIVLENKVYPQEVAAKELPNRKF